MPDLITGTLLDNEVDGAVNLRDLGGYHTVDGVIRKGLVYRSAVTHFLTERGLHQLSIRLRVRAVVDFRNDTELEADGVALFDDHGIAHHHLPVSANTSLTPDEQAARFAAFRDGTVQWGELYADMLVNAADAYARFFRLLEDERSSPLLFHCTGGRDRTGLASALLLGMLGVDDDAIAHDYALTGAALLPHAERFTRVMAEMGLTREEWNRLVATRPEPIHALLARLRDAHGSIPAYLESIGVDRPAQDRIASRLVAPGTTAGASSKSATTPVFAAG